MSLPAFASHRAHMAHLKTPSQFFLTQKKQIIMYLYTAMACYGYIIQLSISPSVPQSCQSQHPFFRRTAWCQAGDFLPNKLRQLLISIKHDGGSPVASSNTRPSGEAPNHGSAGFTNKPTCSTRSPGGRQGETRLRDKNK